MIHCFRNVTGAIVLLCSLSAWAAAPRPNVILFMADDMGMGDTSAYQDLTGNADDVQIATPSMERLANMGVRFTDAHTPSSRCTPTRYALMTGRHSLRTRLKHYVLFGSQGDPLIEKDRPTLATLFRDQGYGTAIVGKWHIGLRYRQADGRPANAWKDADLTQPLYDCPLDHGFDYARYTSRSHGTSAPKKGPGHLHGRVSVTASGPKQFITSGENAYVLSELGSRYSENAIAYLETHLTGGENETKPFFLYYPASSNHTPYTPDKSINGVPVKGAGRMKSDQPASNRHDFVYENDVALGRLLQWLETHDDPRQPHKKLIETTIVIFTSDNGAEKNDKAFTGPWRSNKASCYEGGHRVPFIVAWGGGGIGDGNAQTPGQTNVTPISLVDMYATFSDILGVDLPNLVAGEKGAEDSHSVLPAWRGEEMQRTVPMFYNDHKEADQYGKPKDPAALAMRLDNPVVNRRLVPGQWKMFFDADLLRQGTATAQELYELSSDPQEECNRLTEPGLHALVSHLTDLALHHRNIGGHRLVDLPAGPTIVFDWCQSKEFSTINKSNESVRVSKQGVTLTIGIEHGERSPNNRRLVLNATGLGIMGGASDRVDEAEALLISFDRDVIIESAALFAGLGQCGGYYQVGNAAPMAIYCIDADNDSKNQQGILSDIGVLKAGNTLRLDSRPHYGVDPAGSWTLQNLKIRIKKTTVQTFLNPLLPNAPDPWSIYHEGYYYFTTTRGSKLGLWKTKDITNLANAQYQDIWTPPPGTKYSRSLWAPEIHYLNGKWYFYVAAQDHRHVNHRMFVLENDAADPLQGQFVLKGKIVTDPNDNWAIDGSVFEHKGELYFIWSGWREPLKDAEVSPGRFRIEKSEVEFQRIYIARMKNPWTLATDRIELSHAEYAWEKHYRRADGVHNGHVVYVNEGPQMLKHGRKLHVVYSASGTWTPHYCLGVLSTDVDSDLLNPESWKKHPEPIFRQSPENGVFGTGHNSFFKSPDGTEDWILYHARSTAMPDTPRNPRAQKISWTDDDFPVLGIPIKVETPLKKPSGTP